MEPATSTPEKKAGLAYWANRVLEECDKAGHNFAPDPVHDLRVAIRRCRSMADGFRVIDPDPAWREMKRLAKPLFASLGGLRDTQVMCEWTARLSAPHDQVRHILLHHLQQKETEEKAAAQQALHQFDRQRWSSLNARLAESAGGIPLESLVFQHLALERWNDAHQLHHHALRNRSQASYHRLRIGIKRFRYMVENFLPRRHEKWAKDLRTLQDALGEVHDFDVLWAMIRAHREISVDERAHWRERLLEERQKRLVFYRSRMLGRSSLWHQWRSELPTGAELQRAIRERMQTWGTFLDPDPGHAILVAKLALQIYDGLARQKVIQRKDEDRRLLEIGAMLHEVGRSRRERGHHKRTYRMICNQGVPFGWAAEDLRAVAIVARYHRGALTPSSNAVFAGISASRRSELLRLAGILRLANALDFDHGNTISQVTVERGDGLVVVSAPGFEAISPTAERLARARYLLEATCPIPVTVRPATRTTNRSAARNSAPRYTSRQPNRDPLIS